MDALFDYELPPERIAQHPAPERDGARLMVLRRRRNQIAHHVFRDLPELLNPGDLLVLNDTRVLAARLLGFRNKTGGKWEGLFLRETTDGLWEMLCQTKGKPETGETFRIGSGELCLVLRSKANGHWLMEPQPRGSPAEVLAKHGHIPLPPYIRKGKDEAADRDRYQTVFARADGSIAAPTAGLHFTPAVLERLRQRGISWTHVTLHVGIGTFEPIRTDDPSLHIMHHEWAEVPSDAVEAVRQCKERGGRIIAVGTTATRALESAAKDGSLHPWRSETNLFIQSPYEFKVIDGLITNFHLPRTTLLLLVAAFAGKEFLQRAYAEAIANEYRFYSYGDAMLIL
jgi:S-adenosylmethionine:tRNA ribosyltransferase-isomerase